ncbi:MAG TPA: TolC family protein [Woeseiaceae bacterium]|nr:TolC family protein [Woeseiaceae bacterium]
MRCSQSLAMAGLALFFGLPGPAMLSIASAQSPGPAVLLTLEEANDRALTRSPGIAAARLEVEQAMAIRDARALSTPLELGGEIENFAGTGRASGLDAAATTLSLSKTLERGDKRGLREAAGNARVATARTEVAALEVALAAEVARRYARQLLVQQEIGLATEAIEIATVTLETVDRMLEAGMGTQAERSSARVALMQAELAREERGLELIGARARLAALWGSATPDFDRVAGSLGDLPTLPAFKSLAARLEANPELMRIAARRRVLEKERALDQAQKSPDVRLTAGVRHVGELDATAFVLSFSLPLGSAGRATPLIRESEIALEQLPLSREGRALEIRAALQERFQSARAARLRYQGLQERIIPESRDSVDFYRRGFEAGRNSLLELTSAQEQLLRLRSQALEAAYVFHLAMTEIEVLLGSRNPGRNLS